MKSSLTKKRCKACAPGSPALTKSQIAGLLPQIPGWQSRAGEISKTYHFNDFHQTMEFVNAVAWISHREDHHPDLKVSFNRCEVHYSTHSVKGLSENDFIC